MTSMDSYLRQPAINGDRIAFVTEDDIWVATVDGGPASRLTAGRAEASRPQISPDGRTVAYTSNDEATPEAWSVPISGGDPQRLTYFGAITTQTIGWTPTGKALVATTASKPFPRWTHAWAIDPSTAQAEPLPLGPLRALSYQPDGDGVVLTRNSVDPARWKRYRGGTAGAIWVDRRGDGNFRRILADNPADLAFAMWVGDRIYFLSDHEGIGNLYSVRPTGQDLRRHTDHGEFYARFATTDGRRIVYAHEADIWLFDPAEDTSRKLEITVGRGSAQRSRRFVDPMEQLTRFSLHPAGRSALLETRGQIVDLPLWEQAPRPVAPADGVRQRLASYLPDGETVVAISDEGGEERVAVHPPAAPSHRVDADLGDVWELAAAPTDPPRLAAINHRHELLAVDLDSSDVRLLDRSLGGGMADLAWSPDGSWVAYSVARTPSTRSIALCEVSSGRVVDVTPAEFNDRAPAFSPDGRYLYFLSHRVLDPVADQVFFEFSFPRSVQAFVVPLRASDASPFRPEARPMRDPGSDSSGDHTPPEVSVDVDRIERRAVPLPVPAGNYLTLWPLADSILLLSPEIEGSLGRNAMVSQVPSHAVLKVAVPSGKTEPLITDVAALAVSVDGSTMLYRSKERLRALAAGAAPPGPEAGDEPSRATGWLDLERVRIAVDPPAEWRQMYAESWRLQRDHFWAEDMSGVDWIRIRDRYAPLLDRVGTRAELSDLIWELHGELGTSHAYEIGGDRRKPEPWGVGFLGADFSLDRRGRWRIDRIVRSDSWDPRGGSPLEAPGVDVREGDLILEVNRRPVGADRPIAAELVNLAGLAVELTVIDPRGRRRRHVVVTTMRDETPLRYRAWVEDKRRYVHAATDGAAGYVHIPNMVAVGYSEFHRSYLSEAERPGLVVDVRDNTGGNVSALLLEKLSRKRLGWATQRYGPPMPYAEESPTGPMVCVTNQNAGSDGDIFSHGFKMLGLGPLVGTRTWGGVIGIDGRHRLIDGTVTTQPAYSFWFNDVGWAVENYGTDPDVVIDNRPQDWAEGADPQLDRAISLVQRAIRRDRPTSPDSRRPRLTLPTLPPRAR